MSNAMMAIEAYRDVTGWAFDDESRGLKREAFVMGAPQLIDHGITKLGHDPKFCKSVVILFSHNSFPGYHVHVKKIGEAHGGAWYQSDESEVPGWLCPATLEYFENFPKDIYIRIDSVGLSEKELEVPKSISVGMLEELVEDI